MTTLSVDIIAMYLFDIRRSQFVVNITQQLCWYSVLESSVFVYTVLKHNNVHNKHATMQCRAPQAESGVVVISCCHQLGYLLVTLIWQAAAATAALHTLIS
jgi:hypothetical protein